MPLGIKGRFYRKESDFEWWPSLGVSTIIVHIGFPGKEMRNSTQLKHLHIHTHTRTYTPWRTSVHSALDNLQ